MPYEAKGEYEFKSGGIIDTLKDLQDKFQKRKDELDAQEQKAQDAFNAAVDAKREQIETDKTSLATDEDTYSTTDSEIASTTEELEEEKAQLNDNKLYLKDITGQCETKAKEWDQRSKARNGELTAISKALEILGGKVSEKYEATGAGGRTEPAAETGPKGEELPPKLLLQATKASQAAEVAVEDPEEYQDVVFLQTGSVQKHRLSAP